MKPRNHVVLALIRSGKKGGAHGKSHKQKRANEKAKIKKEME